MTDKTYEHFSAERKRLQREGLAPKWMTTAGYQLLSEKHYLLNAETPKDMYNRLSNRIADLIPKSIDITLFNDSTGITSWRELFFRDLWNGWLSPSSTILSNLGTDKGHPVSCSGTHLGDGIHEFYKARHEIAILTKLGYGTSWDLSSVRARGAKFGQNGIASGVTQPMNGAKQDMRDVSQGSTRRGQIGQYLDVMHKDFDEVNDELRTDPSGLNIGWTFTDEYKTLTKSNPQRADEIWTKVLKTKMQTGKGYFFWKDKVNARRPQMYVDRGFSVVASNLCLEIHLFSDKEHTFSCVLSTVNAYRWDEWKDTKLVQRAMIFLDVVIEDMLLKARKDSSGALENIIRFTENTRAVGLGVQGNTSYMQQNRMVYGEMESRQFEAKLFKHLDEESLKASQYLAKAVGEPEYMIGYGERFSHRLTLPPTKSTSTIMGGYNEGCMPVFANAFTEDNASGEVFRINPVFLELMKDRGMYTEVVMKRIVENNGSVQEEDWLTKHEKKVFLTAFEQNQYTILSMASERNNRVDQGQSINLYIDDSTTEEEISDLHLTAEADPFIFGLYYIRSLNGLAKHKSTDECTACEA